MAPQVRFEKSIHRIRCEVSINRNGLDGEEPILRLLLVDLDTRVA